MMAPATQRVKTVTKADVRERAALARVYLETAQETLEDAPVMGPSAKATVAASNAVRAGIAASDAISGQVLGHCYAGQDHAAAAIVLKGVNDGARLAAELTRLVAQKSAADYGGYLTAQVARDMISRATKLVDAMPTYGIA